MNPDGTDANGQPGRLIGMDEAGYGPNLGPLVVSVSAWDVPDDPRDANLWSVFDRVLNAPDGGHSLQVADSKKVYSPSKGLRALEATVLTALRSAGHRPASFGELWRILSPDTFASAGSEPWFQFGDLTLPHAEPAVCLETVFDRWTECCRRHGVRLASVRSDVVLTERFNRLTRQYNSKGRLLSLASLQLLCQVWDHKDDRPTLIVADKHGGRNRYDDVLQDVLDGPMIFCREEGREKSCYRVGRTDLIFQTKAEEHFAVALASMVSKYVRELAMELFNRFWAEHVPHVKPTKGYPTDARRFQKDVAEAQGRLGIPEETFWRIR